MSIESALMEVCRLPTGSEAHCDPPVTERLLVLTDLAHHHLTAIWRSSVASAPRSPPQAAAGEVLVVDRRS